MTLLDAEGVALEPRLPYGMAKQIVASLRIGDRYTIAPQHARSFHNAARRLGVRVATVAFRRSGQLRYALVPVPEGFPSGHRLGAKPKRDPTTGRWRRGKVI